MNNKPPMQMPSFVGNQPSPPSPPLCFTNEKAEKKDPETMLCGCRKAPKNHCISAVGELIHCFLQLA